MSTGTLWFKQRYVEPILTGEKTTTIRAKLPRFDRGAIVSLHVGPRPRFATVRVLSITKVLWASLDEYTRQGTRELYGQRTHLYQIRFTIV